MEATAVGSGVTVREGKSMKAPGCPGPISMKTGRRQEKPSVWMRIGAERNDGIGSGELMATGDGVCGCAAPGRVQAATSAVKAGPAILMLMQRIVRRRRYCQLGTVCRARCSLRRPPMPTHDGTRSGAILAAVGISLGLVFAGCGQPSSTASVTTPSAANGRPQGGPVPNTLLGDWFLPPAIVAAVEGNSS